ncbi:MAG: hypothetical protein CTY37_03770 [Methylotenera sp.]|nr:MAG: hypothetical protein CTY37_03770 [Methylotenera sp.]
MCHNIKGNVRTKVNQLKLIKINDIKYISIKCLDKCLDFFSINRAKIAVNGLFSSANSRIFCMTHKKTKIRKFKTDSR